MPPSMMRRCAKRPEHGRFVWATTFNASLELAKQGDVALAQDAAVVDIQVSYPSGPGS
jgi:chromatin segregation and condensation protein Rec8/ScpA/Scc1 (kleisin family)